MAEERNPDERSTTQNRLLNMLKVIISLGVLALFLNQVDIGQALQLLREMAWLPFLAALFLFLSGSFVRAYRWGVLVWALGVQVSWWRLVGLYYVGTFFNQFLPTGVGGDAVKMYELSRDDQKAAAAISSVLVDRFLGLFVLFAMALVALVGGQQIVTPQLRALIAVVFVLCLIAVALILQRSWIEALGERLGVSQLLGRIRILRELYGSLHLYGTAALLRATAASVIWNLILIMGYYLLGRAVGIDLSVWYYFLFIPIISALLLVPSVGGLGVREGGTAILFSQVVDEHRAGALALAYLITLWINALLGGALYILQGMREARE
jgi:hypothetical protein